MGQRTRGGLRAALPRRGRAALGSPAGRLAGRACGALRSFLGPVRAARGGKRFGPDSSLADSRGPSGPRGLTPAWPAAGSARALDGQVSSGPTAGPSPQVSELLPRVAGASTALRAARGQSQLLGHCSWGALRADRVTLPPTTPGRAGRRRSPHDLPERPRKRNGAVHSHIHTAVLSDPGYPGRGEPPRRNAVLSNV